MDIRFLHGEVHARPHSGVELLATVDRRTIRIFLDAPTLARLIGAEDAGEAAIIDFLRRNRSAVEGAIEAALYAQGIPLSGTLVMSARDFGDLSARSAALADDVDDAAVPVLHDRYDPAVGAGERRAGVLARRRT
jgi:hypothetical protein